MGDTVTKKSWCDDDGQISGKERLNQSLDCFYELLLLL
jgi:hypothetical protein